MKCSESLSQTGYQNVTEVSKNEGKYYTVAQQCISKEFCKLGQHYFNFRGGKAFVQKEKWFSQSHSVLLGIWSVFLANWPLCSGTLLPFSPSLIAIYQYHQQNYWLQRKQTETTCSENLFTAFNNEYLRCSERLKWKTKTRVVILTWFSLCWGKWNQKRTGVY